MTSDQRSLLAELRRLCERLPVPGADWHPHAAAIGAVRRDFERALGVCAAHPELLDGILDGGDAGSDALTRLDALPRPEGRHPFLDEILPALDAARATLVAVARSRFALEAEDDLGLVLAGNVDRVQPVEARALEDMLGAQVADARARDAA